MAASDAGHVSALRRALLRGLVIPAHPLALTETRRLDERRQVALTRYYCDAGAGGIAVGVHTTQFAIRDPAAGLLAPVLDLAIRTVRDWCGSREQLPGHDRGRLRTDGTSAARSGPRGVARLRCSVAEPCGPARRGHRGPARSLPARGRHHSSRRVLSPAGRRRTRPRPHILARVSRDRARGGNKSRTLRSVSHHGRRHGPLRERPHGRGVVHGERRRHRGRSADALSWGQ